MQPNPEWHRARRRLRVDWRLVSLAPAVLAALAAITAAQAAPDPLKSAIDTEVAANARAARVQQNIDSLADETQRMLDEYRLTLRRTESLKLYNQHVEGMLVSQQDEMASLRQQLQEVEITQREIVPLMLRMIDSLEQFVTLDVPFLLEERQSRIANLKAMLDRADVTAAEKFRRVLEAYQVEGEYGRTIGTYTGRVETGGQARTVEFLRIGRIGLMYLSLDGREGGIWNNSERAWQPLTGEYRAAVAKGLRIASKQAAPDLLELPVAAAEAMR